MSIRNCVDNLIIKIKGLKKICILSFVFWVIFSGIIYAKYIVSKSFDIEINSADFNFEVTSKATDDTLKFKNNKAEFNVLIANNDGTNFNVFDTVYEISLLSNDKFTFHVNEEYATNGVLTQILNANELLNENKVITIVPKQDVSVGFIETLKIKIKAKSPYVKEYNFILTIADNREYAFDYSGTTQSFSAPITGKYKIELWGAEGGVYTDYTSGKGAYTSGIITLTEDETLNITVGGKGSTASANGTVKQGGFNGGGEAYYEAGTGGGASDIRYEGTSLNDRIMVAAGAGGTGSFRATLVGGSGGTLVGISGGNHSNEDYPDMHAGRGGTQISGGAQGELWSGEIREETRIPGSDGIFGIGGFGGYEAEHVQGSGGGGGGYYGGGRRKRT